MEKFNKIIRKIILYDNPNYFELPEEINEKIIINFKESKYTGKKNNDYKINIKELSTSLEIDKIKIIKLLYYNIYCFNNILYNYDTEIILEKDDKNLSYIFYVALLIKYNQNIKNYSFTIELIRSINNMIENNTNMIENSNNMIEKNKNKYLRLILSKVIFDLIDAYKGLNEYNNNKEEIQQIETKNYNKIKELIQIINESNELILNLNLEYFKSTTVDQIYIDIIIGLLKNKLNKIEDYEYIYNTIKEINLESINITKTMFEEIKNFFDEEEKEIMKKYFISTSEDLFDEYKINFLYILLKYILKNLTYIYQIKFFVEIRNKLLKLVEPYLKTNKCDQQIKDKLNYIFEAMDINLEYYKNKYKVKDINSNECKSNISTEIDIPEKNNKKSNSKNFTKTDEENKNIKLTNINNSTNISQSTAMNSSNQSRIIEDNSKSKIENSNNINESNKQTKYSNIIKNIQNSSEQKNISFKNNSSNCSDQNVPNKFKIYKSIKIIGEHITQKKNSQKYTAEFVTEIQNIYISYGTNNELFIYDDSYDIKASIQTEDWIYNVLDYKSEIKTTIEFLACSKNKIYIFSEEKNKPIYKINENKMENKLLFLLHMESGYYFSCCEDNAFLYSSLLDKIVSQNIFSIYKNILLKSAIKINNEFVVFKSNKIVSKGKSQLLLFNYRNKKDIPNFITTEEEYSFVFSPLGQTLLNLKSENSQKDIRNKILLFACKRYIKSQKNGILLLYNMHYIKEGSENKLESIKVDYYFHNTDFFEPYCICPFLIVKPKTILENEVEIKETNYFLVGGFEKKRRQGVIKLYKVDEDKTSQIEYIQDIKIIEKDFKGFKGPISCITQSKKDGNLLITCWDGKVYLVNIFDICFYLKQDDQIKKSAMKFFTYQKDNNKAENNKIE